MIVCFFGYCPVDLMRNPEAIERVTKQIEDRIECDFLLNGMIEDASLEERDDAL